MERSTAPDRSLPSPTLPTSAAAAAAAAATAAAAAAAAADTPGPSYTSHHSPEYVHASSREIAGVMDAICSLAATQAA